MQKEYVANAMHGTWRIEKYSLSNFYKSANWKKLGESTMAKKKRKTIPKPKTTIAMLQESRNGGQLALRGYSYQFLYSCYLTISAMNEGVVFKLEGMEDIDYTICAFDTVTDWIEYWFNTRECVCRLLGKVCICIYKLLEGRSIGGSGAEFDEKRVQYDTYLRGVLSYPKEHRPFEESPDIPKEFSTVQRGYFGSIRNYSNQVVGLIKRDVRMQRLTLYNLRNAIAELSTMQDFFGNMSLDQVYQYKHKVLCEQEDQKLIETYMCCEYYTQHQANADFNKYQVKNWYTSIRGKEIDRVNTAFEMIQKEYHAEFPIQIYEDGRFKCYPIILRSFDITHEEAIQDFLFSAAFISEFPYDFLVLMWCNGEGEIWPVAFRFSKQCLEAIHGFLISGEQEAVDSLFTPYPTEVTSKMLTCFGSNVKLQSKENMNPYSRYIGDIGQELWIYSKNCELLLSDEDSEYLTYMLSEVREKISTMLNEVKVHLSSEIYSDLSALCDLIYKGEIFDDMKLNTLILKYRYM